jgi:hypothetical protein
MALPTADRTILYRKCSEKFPAVHHLKNGSHFTGLRNSLMVRRQLGAGHMGISSAGKGRVRSCGWLVAGPAVALLIETLATAAIGQPLQQEARTSQIFAQQRKRIFKRFLRIGQHRQMTRDSQLGNKGSCLIEKTSLDRSDRPHACSLHGIERRTRFPGASARRTSEVLVRVDHDFDKYWRGPTSARAATSPFRIQFEENIALMLKLLRQAHAAHAAGCESASCGLDIAHLLEK